MGFGIGVVTGIVSPLSSVSGLARFAQDGRASHWSTDRTRVLTAFFLEAGFLESMLFGLHRVGPKLHFFATCMVSDRHASFGFGDSFGE